MIIQENHCTCSQGAIMTLKNTCICMQPYNYINCNCNSNNYPSLAFKDTAGLCKLCPLGCTCTNSGCSGCTLKSNRDSNTCSCKKTYV